MNSLLQTVYPVISTLLPPGLSDTEPAELPRLLKKRPDLCRDKPFLADLAAVELAAYHLKQAPPTIPKQVSKLTPHPQITLLVADWQGLPEYLQDQNRSPTPGETLVLIRYQRGDGSVAISTPDAHELLALKIAVEQLTTMAAAKAGEGSIAAIDSIIDRAVRRGLLLAPASKLCRPEAWTSDGCFTRQQLCSPAFTLQWHITQACDLHCRHCYDRSSRQPVSLSQGISVLDDLYDFCQANNVYGQVSFTGGNPFLHSEFFRLYQETVDRGFLTAILGNPVSRDQLEKLTSIRIPEFYQVSLEGLQHHNDHIRGEGHFNRTLGFLDRLREMGIYSMVMLTLTRANLEQVLPLAEFLRTRADLFTFNRLAMVGQGAALASVKPEDFGRFLSDYLEAARTNPVMSLKDNLFNILLNQQGQSLSGGCTGFGCGAAFNFLSLLPDGELHACRKLPSPIGNIFQDSLRNIYHKPMAECYRTGSTACSACAIRPVCGGCPAVRHGFGLDIHEDPDPYCFADPEVIR